MTLNRLMHYLYEQSLWVAQISIEWLTLPWMHWWKTHKRITWNQRKSSSPADAFDTNTKKIPKHLGFVFHSFFEPFAGWDEESLLQLLLEAYKAGIYYISIYDRNGFWKNRLENLETMYKQLFKTDNEVSSPIIEAFVDNDLYGKWHPMEDRTDLNDNVCSLKVQFLSYQDSSKPRIAKVLRDKCLDEALDTAFTKRLKLNWDTFEKYYNNELNEKFPTQDFLMILGVSWNDLSLDGYSPTALHTTEIFPIPGAFAFDNQTLIGFHKGLTRFAKTVQRHGK